MKRIILFITGLTIFCGQLLAQKSNYYTQPELMFKQATHHFENQQFQRSINLFNTYIEKADSKDKGKLTEAQYRIALASLHLDRKEGEGLMVIFAKQNPSSVYTNTAYFELGVKLFAIDKYKSALKYFQKCDAFRLEKSLREEFFFKKGFSHYELEELEDALVDFKEVIKHDTKYQNAALFYYSHIQYQNENYQTALEGFSKLEFEAAYLNVVPYYMAQIYHYQKSYDKVLEYSPTLLMGEPSEKTAEIARITGDAYYAKKDYSNAIVYLERYKNEIKKATREDIYHLGIAYYKKGNFDKAAETLSKITTREDALSQNAYFFLADCYLKLQDKKMAHLSFQAASRYKFDKYIQEESLYNYAKLNYELAFSPFNETISTFEKLLKLFPESLHTDEVLDLLANVYMTTNNYEGAYQSILKIKVKNVNVRRALQRVTYYRGVEHYKDGHYSQAIHYFNESLNESEFNKKYKLLAYYWRGESWYRQKEYNRALSDYNTFISSPGSFSLPEFKRSHYNMAYAFFKKQNYNAAINWFRKFTNFKSGLDLDIITDAFNRTADCYYLKRNFNQAIKFYNNASEAGGIGSDYAIFQKGFCQGLKKQQSLKIASLNVLIAQYPNSSYTDDAWYEKGKAYLHIENHNEALQAYNMVIESFPNSSYYIKSLAQLALVNYNIGEIDKAQIEYKRIVNEYPSSEEAQTALIALKNISVDKNQVQEYINFTRKVKGIQSIETAEEDSLTFIAAERLYMTGNIEDSNEYFEAYLKNFSSGRYIHQAHYYKADCHLRLNQVDKALIELKELSQPPRNKYTEEALAKGASILYNKKEYPQALEWYSDLLRNAEKQENTLEAKVGVMRCNYLLENSGATILAVEDLLKEPKTDPEIKREALYKKGKSFLNLDNKSAALDAFTIIAQDQQTVEGAEAKYLVAQIYFDMDSIDKTENEVFDFISKNTPHQYWLAKSFILLAKVYIAKDDLFQARQYLQSVRDNYSGDDDVASVVTNELAKLEALEEQQMNRDGKQTYQSTSTNDSIQ